MASSTLETEPTRGERGAADPFANVDLEGFAKAMDALRAELEAELGERDLAHGRKLERWANACTALGYATGWIAPNVVSMALLSTGNVARWAIFMHHVGHKGYEKVPGVPARWTSKAFAEGRRRMLDWPDWMSPRAWKHEHNVLHHYHTNEDADPDLVERNAEVVRELRAGKAAKYALVALNALTWKVSYYAPNTLRLVRRADARRARREPVSYESGAVEGSYVDSFDPRTDEGRAFWRECLLPYALYRFVALPALFAPLGPWASFSVFVNSLGAEALANLHSFAIITPNHAGDDVYRFEGPTRGRAEFYLRQAAGSVNYATGGDLRDFFQGFLNYQIEHHLFPDLPPSAYQRAQPRVKALCERFGVPYRQEPLHKRVRQLVRVMVGDASMLRAGPLTKRESVSARG